MLSLKLSRWLLGYVRFDVHGGSPERFYTCCARSGAYLWNIKPGISGGACILARKYRALRSSARRAGCRLKVTERRGLPFLLYRTRGHAGLWVGGVAFCLIVYLLSLRVWCIQIPDNNSIPREKLEAELASAGLTCGAWKSSIDPQTVSERIMLKFPDIRWMSVNLRGSAADIVIRCKTEKPKIADSKSICNIKASATGQILSMKIFAGTPAVKKGDAVTEGQLLVSAVVVDQSGGSTLTHASAEVTAETKHSFTVSVLMKKHEAVPTGQTLCRRNFEIFGARLPISLHGKPQGSWRVSAEKFDVSLFGTPLPLGMYEERWEEVRGKDSLMTKSQARAAAEAEIMKQAKSAMKDGRVTGKKITEKWGKDNLTVTALLNCEENIAKEVEIYLK